MALYEISRTNITELSRPEYNCSDSEDLLVHDNPGLAMSPDGPKTVEQCVTEYYMRELGCKMPWAPVRPAC